MSVFRVPKRRASASDEDTEPRKRLRPAVEPEPIAARFQCMVLPSDKKMRNAVVALGNKLAAADALRGAAYTDDEDTTVFTVTNDFDLSIINAAVEIKSDVSVDYGLDQLVVRPKKKEVKLWRDAAIAWVGALELSDKSSEVRSAVEDVLSVALNDPGFAVEVDVDGDWVKIKFLYQTRKRVPKMSLSALYDLAAKRKFGVRIDTAGFVDVLVA